MADLYNEYKQRAANLAACATSRLNYHLGAYDNPVWLIGDGRSGTTFVADLINSDRRWREMFEPIHPVAVPRMRPFGYHPYMRADGDDPQLEAAVRDVLRGKLVWPRVENANRRLRYEGLLIKDIFANLLACWAVRRIGGVRPVLLLRNPFAVALSKQKKASWKWVQDPASLLDQPRLKADWLESHEALLREVSGAGDFIDQQVLIWSILTHVPLRQFRPDEVHLLFYEELVEDPEPTLRALFEWISADEVDERVRGAMTKVKRPSRVSDGDSNVQKGTSPVRNWRRELSDEQIERGRALLRHFELDGLYGDDGMPRREVALRLLEGS